MEQNSLIPAAIQDIRNNKVLRVGFVDESSINQMKNGGTVLLVKDGKREEVLAGEYNEPMKTVSVSLSADGSGVLIMAEPKGSTTGANQFLGSKNIEDLAFLSELQDFIDKRHEEMPEGSYTTKLFKAGTGKICKKVGEEAVEAIVEAVNGSRDQFLYECSDMIYHLIVLLTNKGIRIEDLARELKARHK